MVYLFNKAVFGEIIPIITQCTILHMRVTYLFHHKLRQDSVVDSENDSVQKYQRFTRESCFHGNQMSVVFFIQRVVFLNKFLVSLIKKNVNFI